MKIVADENMPGLELWEKTGHEVVRLPGREITSNSLMGADVLLVRSVTHVGQALIKNSSLCFVGSATSGTDHIDQDCLQRAGIPFAAASGANAQSVVDYVFSALAVLALNHGTDWLNLSFGIVGGGNVGGQMCRQLAQLGVNVKLYDPFLDESSDLLPWFSDLSSVLNCGIISLHTPLTEDGPHPTFHLLNKKRLGALNSKQILINTARGAVVDNIALLELVRRRKGPEFIFDVWEGEPNFSVELARAAKIATPHIAGYSAQSKLKATVMLFSVFSTLCDAGNDVLVEDLEARPTALKYKSSGQEFTKELSWLILQAYDVQDDAGRFRTCFDNHSPSVCFDRQRKEYPFRNELSRYCITGLDDDKELRKALTILGFQVT